MKTGIINKKQLDVICHSSGECIGQTKEEWSGEWISQTKEEWLKETNKIDWAKEKATKNYCGYCISYSSCNGECFKDPETGERNKIDHILIMGELIPKKIENLKQRLIDLRSELSIKK